MNYLADFLNENVHSSPSKIYGCLPGVTYKTLETPLGLEPEPEPEPEPKPKPLRGVPGVRVVAGA